MPKTSWLLPLLLLLTVLVYLPGLPGPFLFDDAPHVSKNTQVHIKDLSPSSLYQAWHSSHAKGTASRPLAQLTFGVNHALSGLESGYFKASNLAIHLVNGLLIFALARQLTRVLGRRQGRYAELDADWAALLVAALWLLSPLNFTPVLYVVQRMTSLAALFVLAGLWCHVTGRLRLADGDSRGLWLALGGLPLAGIGILAKETAALYPLLVLALEWTLLRRLAAPRRGLILASTAVLPVVLGIIYLANHPGMLNFDGRAFTLGERLVTEARVLWLYLRMLFVPDLSMLGLFHDDVATSTSLASPWTTLPAVIVWLALTAAAIALAKRWPVASFAVLFFLAGHILESSIFPLELIFEHRNYLPSFGPWFAVGVGGLLLADHVRHGRWLKLGLAVYLALLAGVTHLRAWDWSNEDRLTLSEAERHPQSMRANFVLAKRLISALPTAPDPAQIYAQARHYLEHVRALAPDNLDALFALVVLNLHVSHQPEAAWVEQLQNGLREGVVDPLHVSTSQFSYLVQWHMAGGYALPRETVIGIFEAALANPRFDSYGRAGILSALRAYYLEVLHEPEKALVYAQESVRYWPERWHYQKRLVELLVRLGRLEDAERALSAARRFDAAGTHIAEAAQLAQLIAGAGAQLEGTTVKKGRPEEGLTTPTRHR